MAAQVTTFRLGADTREQLDYLASLTGQSQAKVVAELVNATVEWILEWAVTHGLESTPILYYRDGTRLSREEQQAVRQWRMRQSPLGAELWAHRRDAPEQP